MPTFNAARYLREAVDSILAQTYEDFEFLVVDDDSRDGTREILASYNDSRIKVIDGPGQGISGALNLGLCLAQGEYIARMDADDIALPDRFKKQVAYLDAHQEVGICGSWQQHFGEGNWIHKAPSSAAQSRANLLFFCDLCHSTLMLRKRVFLENKLFYDNRYASEDFQLWTRAMDVTDIVSLPEILGKYRHGEDNITPAKFNTINDESGRVVATTLWRTLGMKIKDEDTCYLNSWANMFFDAPNETLKQERLARFEALLREIWATNQRFEVYDPQSLLQVFAAKWGWARFNLSLWDEHEVHSLDDVFSMGGAPMKVRAAIDTMLPKGTKRRQIVKGLLYWLNKSDSPAQPRRSADV